MMQRLDPSASAEQFQQALAQESIGNGLSIAAAILLTVIVNRIGRRQGAVAGTPVARPAPRRQHPVADLPSVTRFVLADEQRRF